MLCVWNSIRAALVLRPRPVKSCVDCVRVDVRAAVPFSVWLLEHGAASGTGPKPCACLEWSGVEGRGGGQTPKKNHSQGYGQKVHTCAQRKSNNGTRYRCFQTAPENELSVASWAKWLKNLAMLAMQIREKETSHGHFLKTIFDLLYASCSLLRRCSFQTGCSFAAYFTVVPASPWQMTSGE